MTLEELYDAVVNITPAHCYVTVTRSFQRYTANRVRRETFCVYCQGYSNNPIEHRVLPPHVNVEAVQASTALALYTSELANELAKRA